MQSVQAALQGNPHGRHCHFLKQGKGQWRAQHEPKRRQQRTKTQAHQPKRQEVGHESKEYLLKIDTEENGTPKQFRNLFKQVESS